MHTHLPADICNASSALPALITYASQGNHQASAAISALQNLHKVLQNRPASCSLFLDAIIQNGGNLLILRLSFLISFASRANNLNKTFFLFSIFMIMNSNCQFTYF